MQLRQRPDGNGTGERALPASKHGAELTALGHHGNADFQGKPQNSGCSDRKMQIWLWATDTEEAATKSGRKSVCREERSRGPSPASPFRSPQPPLQDGDGGNGVTLPTHCPRSCRRLCGAGNRRSCRWRRDGPSSRSRTSPSRGSDPGLCQSSDRPDLPGREDAAAHRRSAAEREHSPATPAHSPAAPAARYQREPPTLCKALAQGN